MRKPFVLFLVLAVALCAYQLPASVLVGTAAIVIISVVMSALSLFSEYASRLLGQAYKKARTKIKV